MSFNHIHKYAYQNNIIETTRRCQLDNAFSKCSGTLVHSYVCILYVWRRRKSAWWWHILYIVLLKCKFPQLLYVCKSRTHLFSYINNSFFFFFCVFLLYTDCCYYCWCYCCSCSRHHLFSIYFIYVQTDILNIYVKFYIHLYNGAT